MFLWFIMQISLDDKNPKNCATTRTGQFSQTPFSISALLSIPVILSPFINIYAKYLLKSKGGDNKLRIDLILWN